MAIKAGAVQRFMSRKLRDLSRVADIDDKRLIQKIKSLPGAIPNPSRLYRHQREMFFAGANIPRMAFFAEMGLGKTLLALYLLRYHQSIGNIGHALVLVPNVVNIANWVSERDKHLPDLHMTPLFGSSTDRWDTIQRTIDAGEKTIFVLNYAGLVAMCTTRPPPAWGKRRKTTATKSVVDQAAVAKLTASIGGLVLDESQALRSWRSLTYKICSALSESLKVCYGLTGTPFGRDPHHVWPQMRVIDGGQALGYTLGIFRAAYFNVHPGRFSKYEYTLKRGAKQQIHRALRHSSLRYRDVDCLDLPEQVFTDVPIIVPEANQRYYAAAMQELKKAGGDPRAIESCFIRLRQIPSGWLGMRDDGDTIEIDFPENPKIEALLQILDSVPPNRKVVVFHEFIHTGALITEALKGAKITHRWLWGGQTDKVGVVNAFQHDPKVRVLVANTASGGAGLNLQVSNYVVFHELPVSPITYAQAVKRCHRIGQKRRVYYYRLLARGTVDLTIADFIARGESLLRALLDGEASL